MKYKWKCNLCDEAGCYFTIDQGYFRPGSCPLDSGEAHWKLEEQIDNMSQIESDTISDLERIHEDWFREE